MRGVPLSDGTRCISRTHRTTLGQLGNTGIRPIRAVLLCQQLRGALSGWRRLSFALPAWKWFRILSCHSRPDRRGHIRRITHRRWLLRSSQCCLRFPVPPSRDWGGHEPRGPEIQRFHVLHSIRDGFRSALYTVQSCGSHWATLEGPDPTACRFGPSLNQPRMAGFLCRCLQAFN